MRNQTPFLDYATKDYLGYRQLMIDQIPIKMPEYTERSESDAGISIIELLSYGLDVTSFNIDIIANEAFLYTAREIENVLKWTNSFGDPRRSSSSAVFQQVFEVQKSASPIYIPRGTKIRTATAMNELPIVFETTDDLEIPAGMVGNEQNPDGTYKYFVDVIEGVSVYDDVLGTSNAVQSQTFRLSYTPVIADSVRIFVNEGSGANEWRRVPNFLESTADSQVFSINIETNGIGILQFGNGNSGKIPTPFLNGISATYRTGGGTIGNVGAYKIVEMQSPIAGVIKTYNPSGPKIAGRDLETVQEIKDNFLRRLRTNERAVTKFDFPNVMMLYPNQEMIDAKIQLDEAENTVIVYVLFKNMPQEEFPYWPMDFDYTKMAEPYRGLNEYLAHRSMVNIHTYVVTAKRQPVDLTLSVTAQANYRNEDVRNRVYAAIADYFAEENVKIGHPVIMSDLICALQDLEGVYLVHIQTLQDSLIIADDSYATLGTLNVTVDGGLA